METRYNKTFQIGYEKIDTNYEAIIDLVYELDEKKIPYEGTWEGKNTSLTIKISSDDQKLWLKFLSLGFEEV